MSIGGIVAGEGNEVLAAKLLDAAYVQQRVNAENASNWMVPGVKEVGISKSFQDQLNSMIDLGNFEGIEELEVTTEETGRDISYERVMRQVKSVQLDSQFLQQVLTNNFRRIETVLER